MSCLICGKQSCIPSFHSLQEQEDIDKTKRELIGERDNAYDLLNDLKNEIRDSVFSALKMANGQWNKWGSDAVLVAEILEETLDKLKQSE